MPIAPSEGDKIRHLLELRYLNDANANYKTIREIEEMIESGDLNIFDWPKEWPPQELLCSLVAFTLNYNHDHIIAWEIEDRGISRFMHKTGTSKASHYNYKYQETGSFFQGPYNAKLIDQDEYLRWVIPYVTCKNTFEMHPKGYDWCIENFNEAWEWAINYPYSSLGVHAGRQKPTVIDPEAVEKLIGNPRTFKKICRDMILGREKVIEKEKEPILFDLTFEQ